MTRGILLGSIGFSLVLLAACGAGDSDTDTFPEGPTGRGGSSAKGGSGGKAGAGAKAGSSASGSGGSAGTAGAAGKSGAGAGGATGGAAGKAGSTGGGAAGAAGATGGKAGSSGGPAMCSAGRGDCNESAADGCETDLTNSKDHCGACDAACPGVPSANVTCQSGKCVNTCFLGTGDCDGDTKNGCETNTNQDPKNCGTCGAPACADGPNGVGSCEGGSCAFACNAGFGNCNDQPGCETTFATDPLNCGACGLNCGQGATCKNGACECAASTSVAELLPVDLHLLLDSSGSMAAPVKCEEKCNFFFCFQECSSKTRWSETTSALKSFISGATAADKIGMGLTFFPKGNSEAAACNVAGYETPVVPATDLPGGAALLISTIDGKSPNGGTPTQPAVRGALNQAIAFQAAHPDRKSVLLLATDGRPEGCGGNSIASVGTTIADGKAKGIPTYVIGIFTQGSGGDEAELKPGLQQWAVQGGSTKAYFPAVGDNLAVEFKNALDDIRKTAIGCEYSVPKPTGGQAFDPNKVNVSYAPGAGGAEQPLVNVADAAACKPGAWYYDNPAAPTKILLCPAVCDTVKADAAAKVNVSVGCGTRKD